jgi:hypothetical protein
MPAGKHDIYIEQGATWSLPLIWQTAEGVPIDVTGYTARMHIRKKLADDEFEAELTTENGSIAIGGADGAITLSLTAEQTTAIDIKGGVYDLEMVKDAVVTRLLEGTVIISLEVTRQQDARRPR